MKIAFVVSRLTKFGGLGIDLMNYSNYLALEGHKVCGKIINHLYSNSLMLEKLEQSRYLHYTKRILSHQRVLKILDFYSD